MRCHLACEEDATRRRGELFPKGVVLKIRSGGVAFRWALAERSKPSANCIYDYTGSFVLVSRTLTFVANVCVGCHCFGFFHKPCMCVSVCPHLCMCLLRRFTDLVACGYCVVCSANRVGHSLFCVGFPEDSPPAQTLLLLSRCVLFFLCVCVWACVSSAVLSSKASLRFASG